MRRPIVLIALLALALPAAALAVPSAVGDGTLVVRNGSGGDPRTPVVTLIVKGAVLGQIDRGRIVIDSPSDGPAPIVTGAASSHDVSDTKTVWTGSDIRFRAVGGSFVVKIFGIGVNVNAVGQGFVRLVGSPFLQSDGRYSLNGKDFQSLPDDGGPLLRIGT